MTINRRAFLVASGGLSLAPLIPRTAQNPGVESDAAKDVTRTLARYLVSAKAGDLPAAVRKEAARTLLNWVGISAARLAYAERQRLPESYSDCPNSKCSGRSDSPQRNRLDFRKCLVR